MKKVVCILVLSLAAISIAYGQVAELPPAGTTPTSGAEVAPVVVVEPAVAQPPEAAPPPIHSTSGIRRVLGPPPGARAGGYSYFAAVLDEGPPPGAGAGMAPFGPGNWGAG